MAVPLTLIIAIVFGIVNGFLIAKVNITPIVATLATNAILMGGGSCGFGDNSMTAPAELAEFSHSKLLVSHDACVGFAVYHRDQHCNQTHDGRAQICCGGGKSSRRNCGAFPFFAIRLRPMRLQLYVLPWRECCSGFIGSASQTAGVDYLLPAIAAVVVGGTPFTGGRGSVIARELRPCLWRSWTDGISTGAGTPVQLLVQALVIVIAVAVRQVPDLLRFLKIVNLKPNEYQSYDLLDVAYPNGNRYYRKYGRCKP